MKHVLLTCRFLMSSHGLLTNQKKFHKKINTTSSTLPRVFETKKSQKIVNMAKKKEVYLSKAQIQRLCELYPHYFKKDKKQAALIRIKEALENDHEDLPTCTGIILILF